MPSRKPSRLPLRAVLVVFMIAPLIAIFAVQPWLKQQPGELVSLLTAAAATITVAACLSFGILVDRQSDEYNRGNARFSSQWGWIVGSALVALLLALPAFRELIVSWAAAWAEAPNPDQKLVVLAFTLGVGVIAVAQAMCSALLSLGWAVWKSRAAHDHP
ncbi:MAG: hypothetical protein NW206_08390 [Hyphomonadaceae bacterium]|nr:hypothetical protein [Hyphomonadaceae bacterium]